MMKILFFVGTLLMTSLVYGQENPAHFDFKVEKKDKNYVVSIVVTLDEGWHIYSQTQPKEAVAQPTTFVFNKNPLIVINGSTKEIGAKEKYEEKTVGIIQYQYADHVDFVQNITMKATVKTNLTGTITYQTCTDERCLPVKTIPFTIPL